MIDRTMPLPSRAIVAAALAAMLLGACSKKEAPADKGAPPAATTPSTATPPPAAQTDREIRITEIRPELGTLTVGQSVKTVISGTYKLPSPGGTIGILVQDGKSGLVFNKLTPVADSGGVFTQEVEFKVPPTDKLSLHVPLYLKDEKKSSAVASREWAVKAK